MTKHTTVRAWLLHEAQKTALATAYFFVGFNLLALMFVLLDPEFREPAALFAAATFSALVVGKVIVVADGVFRRFVHGRGSFVGNVALKSVVFSLVVIAALATEELLHAVFSEDLSWSEASAVVLENARGGRRFIARFIYVVVLFGGYSFLFEIDRYFVGTTVADIILSKYRRAQEATHTVMYLRSVDPIASDTSELRAAATRELYEVFSGLAAEADASLEAYQGRAGLVVWSEKVEKERPQALFDAMTDYLEEHAEAHRQRYGQPFQLRGSVVHGRVQTLEVTSGPRREVIRCGPAIDRAEQLDRQREDPGLRFDA